MAPQYPPVISPYFSQEEEFPNYARGAMYTRPMFSPYLVPNPTFVANGRGLSGDGGAGFNKFASVLATGAALYGGGGGVAGYFIGGSKHRALGIVLGVLSGWAVGYGVYMARHG